MSKFKFPTEEIELPSQGYLYPETSPLSSGKIEMKYMTTREEDILTNQNYIKQGIVLDKLLQSMIVTPINYDELLAGDKDGIMLAARILGYGADYSFEYKGEQVTIDLSAVEAKPLKTEFMTKGTNLFEFTTPKTGTKITFSLLTHGDEKAISADLKGLQKVNKNASAELSTRFKHMIKSVEGSTDAKDIREFVDNFFLASDSKAFRNFIKQIQPGVDLLFDFEGPDGVEEGVQVPIGVSFFWPES
jgi:hypothetical protein